MTLRLEDPVGQEANMTAVQNKMGSDRVGWAGAFVKDLDFTLMRCHCREMLRSKNV